MPVFRRLWHIFFCYVRLLMAGFFPAIFAGLFSILLKRFGNYAIFSAPFLWTAMEFLRFWITGNNWNEIAYSQAFNNDLIQSAKFGGIYLLGFQIVAFNSAILLIALSLFSSFSETSDKTPSRKNSLYFFRCFYTALFIAVRYIQQLNSKIPKRKQNRLLSRFSRMFR